VTARAMLREVAYRTGALDFARRGLHNALTVVMFHRVLDPADPDIADADPEWTVTTPLFDQALTFFQNHYTVVGIKDVLASCAGTRPLPDHALLITFDDGWADNLYQAAPLLRSRGMPAVVFVVPEAVLSPAKIWWQEQLYFSARTTGLASWARQDGIGGDGQGALAIATRLGRLEPDARSALIAQLPAVRSRARMMLTPEDLPRLIKLGVDIGIHGFGHTPLTAVDDVEAELRRARSAVAELCGGKAIDTALACPHGLWNETVIAAAARSGMKAVFTSVPHLVRTRAGLIEPPRPLPRIPIFTNQLSDGRNGVDEARAARWLWARPAS
jgi:peptidoglycan/xylan/chitin deacetylase (PgdA/CDA1 family)